MTAVTKIKGEVDILRLPVDAEEHQFYDWTISYKKSHILHSQCNTTEQCSKEDQDSCIFCLYTNTLELPHLPEMVFAKNTLTLKHSSGVQIEFNALDALKRVSNGKQSMKVAYSDAWRETRPPEHLEEKFKPFDWTFSTDYRGSVTGPSLFEETEERIDIDRLKEKEKILFYQELMLYEDELHDNGIATCTVKIRVMPSSFFVLLRFYLRVDNVMVRVNDTRLFHSFQSNYILREYTNRECGFKEVGLPLPMFSDPNLISPNIPLRTSIYEKLVLHSTNNTANETNSAVNNLSEVRVSNNEDKSIGNASTSV